MRNSSLGSHCEYLGADCLGSRCLLFGGGGEARPCSPEMVALASIAILRHRFKALEAGDSIFQALRAVFSQLACLDSDLGKLLLEAAPVRSMASCLLELDKWDRQGRILIRLSRILRLHHPFTRIIEEIRPVDQDLPRRLNHHALWEFHDIQFLDEADLRGLLASFPAGIVAAAYFLTEKWTRKAIESAASGETLTLLGELKRKGHSSRIIARRCRDLILDQAVLMSERGEIAVDLRSFREALPATKTSADASCRGTKPRDDEQPVCPLLRSQCALGGYVLGDAEAGPGGSPLARGCVLPSVMRLMTGERPPHSPDPMGWVAAEVATVFLSLHEDVVAELFSAFSLSFQVGVFLAYVASNREGVGVASVIDEGRLASALLESGFYVGRDEDRDALMREHLVERAVLLTARLAEDRKSALLEEVWAAEPASRETVGKWLWFKFSDMATLGDEDIRLLLREIANDELVISLLGAGDAIKERFFSNLTDRTVRFIKDDLAQIGRIRRSEVDKARQEILRALFKLARAGKVKL